MQHTWIKGPVTTYGELRHGERYLSPGRTEHSFKLGLPSGLTEATRQLFNATLVFRLILVSEAAAV